MREKKKIKVYELARTLKIKERELLAVLVELNIEVSTKFSPLSDEDVDRVKTWCEQNRQKLELARAEKATIRRRRRRITPKT